MPGAAPPETGSGQSLSVRALRALGGVVLQHPSAPPDTDFLGPLTEEEDKVLGKHWPSGKPSGDGVDYFDQWMQIRVRRRKWRARIATGGEIVWLTGKVAGLVICFGFGWQHFVV